MSDSSFLRIDAKRFEAVYEDIATGSEPGVRFYILVAVSTLIASFGLIANSTAVVIGAMLVAPLMTPIFGISLSLIRGDTHLFKNAVQAEIIGVISAIAMGFLLGFLLTFANPFPETTPEMLGRTKPNLYDLFVAVLAGFAGTYALIDEKISPALPGVAIATAIVPPLANSGLCIAYGAYRGAFGSFLLFFANFLSILLIASTLFIKAGMMRKSGTIKRVGVARRFGLATVCFVFMAMFLGNALYKIVKERKLRIAVQNALISEFAQYPATGIDKLIINNLGNKAYILVELHSPSQITPDQVEDIETELATKTSIPIELIVRTIKSSDTSSSGSNSAVAAQGLDGFFVSPVVNPTIHKIRLSEQAIREYLDDKIGLDLLDVDYLNLLRGPTILAMITGIRKLYPTDIQEMERLIKERTTDHDLNLMIRFVKVDLLDKEGNYRYGWTSLINPSAKQLHIKDTVLMEIEKAFLRNGTHLVENINTSITEKGYTFLVEISGTSPYNQADLIQLQDKLNRLSDKPVKVYIWFNHGVVVTDKGLASYEKLTKSRVETELAKQRIKEVTKSLR